ncbi:DUF803-domain-containing protein [Flagelloscypha sp. PMI_526]|nr:DUF803-domain-containing protein [Flagelloscypha sp. PMI_526]
MDFEHLGKVSVKRETLIGIVICITGNILISLALNIQKLAHHKVAEKHEIERLSTLREEDEDDLTPRRVPRQDPLDNIEERSERTQSQYSQPSLDPTPNSDRIVSDPDVTEHTPLVNFPILASRSEPVLLDYGSASSSSSTPPNPQKRHLFARLFRSKSSESSPPARPLHANLVPVDVIAANRVSPPKGEVLPEGEADHNSHEGDYLKSKLWWAGFVLMNLGECGNFISYAWAPASVVAPLGTFALIANCFFAPLILGERFRKRDGVGILLAIIGAVTVVLSSPSSQEGDPRLNPSQLIAAISRTPFVLYTIIYVVFIALLATFSEMDFGKRFVFIDVGICALFGGFTVLSTKAISSLLTMEWIKIFKEWITYPTVAVLIGTGVGQIRYLNRALMRFDSKVVIPIQFVLFNLSAIVGSSILYGDFEHAQFHQIVTFLYGCAATFAGVFVITWSSSSSQAADSKVPNGGASSPLSDMSQDTQNGISSLAQRRERSALVLPPVSAVGSDGTRSTPVLRTKQSAMSVRALSSPAQHLLLAHTPPTEPSPLRRDLERGVGSPESIPRRWTIWSAGPDVAYMPLRSEGPQSRRTSLSRDYRDRMGSMPRSAGGRNPRSGSSLTRDWRQQQQQDPGSAGGDSVVGSYSSTNLGGWNAPNSAT